ncbi:hypothetical protein LTR84_012388 [Exophiala bonariae]|uniref:NACHT-NTPase and P-loop NTPases N-terminal domain-containing protein n=1 Tax=Exophiala bonariae TaxID=1690606 RepID=A0AAV9NKH5_9EURO|nr:hypothetical protein LTR84_012388 [Exophiala bonariae]
MSGAEAALVLGLISASISTIDAAKKVYDAVHDAAGLPRAFREMAVRMPLVLAILRKAERQLKNGKVEESMLRAIHPLVEHCKLKSDKLSTLLREALAGEDASRFERYQKAIRTIGKGGRVRELMVGILTDIQLLAENRSMGAATEDQFEQLLHAIEDIKKHDPSFPDDIQYHQSERPDDQWYVSAAKTQLALDYAYRRNDANNCSVFWIRGDSEDVFMGSYGDIAKEANLPETLTGDDKLRAVRKWIECQNN